MARFTARKHGIRTNSNARGKQKFGTAMVAGSVQIIVGSIVDKIIIESVDSISRDGPDTPYM